VLVFNPLSKKFNALLHIFIAIALDHTSQVESVGTSRSEIWLHSSECRFFGIVRKNDAAFPGQWTAKKIGES
jgi:hypothetical protein